MATQKEDPVKGMKNEKEKLEKELELIINDLNRAREKSEPTASIYASRLEIEKKIDQVIRKLNQSLNSPSNPNAFDRAKKIAKLTINQGVVDIRPTTKFEQDNKKIKDKDKVEPNNGYKKTYF
jgi:hypothetical protein